jgi:hypothetical protein
MWLMCLTLVILIWLIIIVAILFMMWQYYFIFKNSNYFGTKLSKKRKIHCKSHVYKDIQNYANKNEGYIWNITKWHAKK